MTSVLKEMADLLAEKAEGRRQEQLRREQLYTEYCEANADRMRLLEILGAWLTDTELGESDITVSIGYSRVSGGLNAVLHYRQDGWKIEIDQFSVHIVPGIYALDCLEGQTLLAQCAIPWIAKWVDTTALELGIDLPVFWDGSDEPTNAELAEVTDDELQ